MFSEKRPEAVPTQHKTEGVLLKGGRSRDFFFWGCTPRGLCNSTRLLKGFLEGSLKEVLLRSLVAQCSATPATVAATPPCSATPFQTQVSVRHLPGQGGGRCDTKIFRGCSATPVLHLQNAIKSRKSAATRVARHV